MSSLHLQPNNFFHSIYFCDVSLKNYLILHVKQKKSIIMSDYYMAVSQKDWKQTNSRI